jgi:hypothetical protein
MQSKKAQNLDFLIGYAIMVMITGPAGGGMHPSKSSPDQILILMCSGGKYETGTEASTDRCESALRTRKGMPSLS